MGTFADVLVVTAHPDDAEFGAAGAVARWTRQGRRVAYVVCTSGEKGTSDRRADPGRFAAIREREQRAAAETLGVGEVVFLRYPDQGLEDTPAFRKEIVRQIRRFRPEVVVTSDPYRRYIWHRDHRVLGQVVLDAVFPYARDHLAYPDLLEEGWEPHKVREVWFWAAEDPNHRVDITETFATKVAALACHETQMREMNLPDPGALLRGWAEKAAEGTPYALAEAFYRVVAPG
ncbi:MAG: PIG-L family deacetylase [Deferrisomatales bacterium]